MKAIKNIIFALGMLMITSIAMGMEKTGNIAESYIQSLNITNPDAIIKMFNRVPYIANALDIANALQNLPIMNDPKIVGWITAAKKRLNKGPELVKAAKMGTIEKTRELLRQKDIDLNWQDKDGWTALIYAAEEGHTNIAELLINAGANPDLQSKTGWNALIIAAQQANVPLIKKLLDVGAYPDAQHTTGWTALMFAAAGGNMEIVHALLEAGANPNIENQDGETALVLAKDHEEVFNYILEFKRALRRKAFPSFAKASPDFWRNNENHLAGESQA